MQSDGAKEKKKKKSLWHRQDTIPCGKPVTCTQQYAQGQSQVNKILEVIETSVQHSDYAKEYEHANSDNFLVAHRTAN